MTVMELIEALKTMPYAATVTKGSLSGGVVTHVALLSSGEVVLASNSLDLHG